MWLTAKCDATAATFLRTLHLGQRWLLRLVLRSALQNCFPWPRKDISKMAPKGPQSKPNSMLEHLNAKFYHISSILQFKGVYITMINQHIQHQPMFQFC